MLPRPLGFEPYNVWIVGRVRDERSGVTREHAYWHSDAPLPYRAAQLLARQMAGPNVTAEVRPYPAKEAR